MTDGMNLFKAVALSTLLVLPAAAAVTTAQKENSARAVLDSITLLSGHLSSSNLTQAEGVIGFSGDLMSRAFNSRYGATPLAWSQDRNRTEMDADFNVRMEVKPSPFLALWTRITFGYDFSGHFVNNKAQAADYERTHINRDKVRDGAGIFEDLTAGVSFRTRNFSGRLLAGSAVWVDASPLTIWKRDTRPVWGWYYDSYEPELSSAAYYSQKSFGRRDELGRLLWPKKPFGGIYFETFKMPMDLGVRLFVAEPVVMAGTKPTAGSLTQVGDPEALNSQNNSGDLFQASIFKERAFSDVKVGLNALWTELDENLVIQRLPTPFVDQGFIYQFVQNDSTFILGKNRDPFFVDTRILSIDFTGNITPKLYIQTDIAMSMDDTTLFRTVVVDTTQFAVGNDNAVRILPFDHNTPKEHKTGAIQPAFYSKISSKIGTPLEVELTYIPKLFNSPYGLTNFTVPLRQDAINLGVGSSFYHNNITGLKAKWMPKVPWGFLQFGFSEHIQAEAGRDFIRFNYRLNGRDVWRASSSWARTEPTRLMSNGSPYLNPRWKARLGDLGPNRNRLYNEAQEGGLYGDDLMLWEGFVAYENAAQANAGIVPVHRKWASSATFDLGYNAAPLVGFERKIMLTLYGNLSSVATTANTSDPLMWTAYLRSEPVIAVTPKFHLIGLLGIETWRSDYAYLNTNVNLRSNPPNQPACQDPASGTQISCDNLLIEETIVKDREIVGFVPVVNAVAMPIDYMQLAYGMGFDWDYAPRAGLHVRYKYATHTDKNFSENDWDGHFLFAETKVWF